MSKTAVGTRFQGLNHDHANFKFDTSNVSDTF